MHSRRETIDTFERGLRSGGDLWRVVNNTDIFISCELISQTVIGLCGSNTVKVRHQLVDKLLHTCRHMAV